MSRNGGARQIKRVRSEVLVALKMLYPAALQGEQILRTLLAVENVEADIILGFFFPGASMPDVGETDAAERAPAPGAGSEVQTPTTAPERQPGSDS